MEIMNRYEGFPELFVFDNSDTPNNVCIGNFNTNIRFH